MSNTLELPDKSESKYHKMASSLRSQIQRGELRPGDRLPSLAEMYEQHNLSRSTVERVHRLLEKDGLVVREQGRGTFVADRSKRRSGLIGVGGYCFEKKPRMSYWSQVLNGMQECAQKEGQSLVLLDHQTLSGWDKVDGLVIAENSPLPSMASEKLPPTLPRISILTDATEHAAVIPDDYSGGRLATEHLLDLGHRRIACMMNKTRYPTDRRFAGYRDALEDAGITFNPLWVREYNVGGKQQPDFAARGAEIMREWLSQDWYDLGCTALLLQNDCVAPGVINVLQGAGISIPKDISIVGYDDVELCSFMSPGLTSVHVPLYEIGSTAVSLLLREIETGRSTEGATVLPVRLERRQSTAPPAR